MAGATYRIKIEGAVPATFSQPNLQVTSGDVVHWDNQSPNTHELWELDGNDNPVGVPLGASRWPAVKSSKQTPAWSAPNLLPNAAPMTIRYGCLRHRDANNVILEKGTITVAPDVQK
jgi:hypothetical protein